MSLRKLIDDIMRVHGPAQRGVLDLMREQFESCGKGDWMAGHTKEQAQLRAQLLDTYGVAVVVQADNLSGLTMCLVALGQDELTTEQREHLYRQASLHLALLLETVMSPEHSAKVSECAKRMDTAIALWTADDIERKGGLPTA